MGKEVNALRDAILQTDHFERKGRFWVFSRKDQDGLLHIAQIQ